LPPRGGTSRRQWRDLRGRGQLSASGTVLDPVACGAARRRGWTVVHVDWWPLERLETTAASRRGEVRV